MLILLISLVLGLVTLVWSANLFISGSASTAKHMGMSPVMIGLTIVALGTSAPEIIVSADAALDGAPGLGIGNAIGSNIANIGLVLGVTALFATIPVASGLLKRELPLLLAVTAACGACLWDYYLSFVEGLLLLSSTALVVGILIYASWRAETQAASGGNSDCLQGNDPCEPSHDVTADIPELSPKKSWVYLLFGLLVLLGSADLLVWSATGIAEYFKVDPLIIGLTIVALGTSLPELAASITSALKGHHDIAVGNIMGSNILNILAVMSLPGIISPTSLPEQVLTRDYWTMAFLTVLLSLVIIHHVVLRHRANKRQGDNGEIPCGGIGKRWGTLFLLGYIGYYIAIIMTAK